MKLYNTLTKQVEVLEPQAPPTVTIYTCGPTVYDYPHIGNWFTFIRYDLLIRTLKVTGLRPKWVMNITDVGHLTSDADDGEDKLEVGAKREGKTAWNIATFYGNYFIHGLDRLNFSHPDYLLKATEHIPEQIDLITKLAEKGFTYIIDDGVYFDTSKFPTYADFARLDLDEQQAGARVVINPQKRNPPDFALWKFSPNSTKRDMEWDSPWGKGFPGWHIECSAMSIKYLGETLDIHSGGIDHIPVHHTNEIAQSEAATGKPFARYWMHTNHVLVEGEKIGKSLGNGITLEAVEAKGFSLEAFRLHVLESHYRSQSKFSWESLEAAQNRLKNYQAMADLRWQIRQGDAYTGADYPAYLQEMRKALENDLNTPQVLAILSQTASDSNDLIIDFNNRANDFLAMLHFVDNALGLQLLSSKDITEEQKALVVARDHARNSKDWAKSDALRDELEKQGVGLRDNEMGAIWYRL